MSDTAVFTGLAGQETGNYDWEARQSDPALPFYGATNWSTGNLPFGDNLQIAGFDSQLGPNDVFAAATVEIDTAQFSNFGTLLANALIDGSASNIDIYAGLVQLATGFTLDADATLDVAGTLQVLGGFHGADAVGGDVVIDLGATVEVGVQTGGGFTLTAPTGFSFTDRGVLDVGSGLTLQGRDVTMSFVQAALSLDQAPAPPALSLIDNAAGSVTVIASTITVGSAVPGAVLQLGESGDHSVLDLTISGIVGPGKVDNQSTLNAQGVSTILTGGGYLNDGAGAVTEVEDGVLRFGAGNSFTSIGAASQGIFEIGGGGTLDLDRNQNVGGALVTFTASDGTLALADDADAFSGTVLGFAGSDAVEIKGADVALAEYDGAHTVNILEVGGGVFQLTDIVIAGRAAGDLTVSNSDGNGFVSLCYLRGTRILTPTGEVPVEALAIGDVVVTRFSGMVPVRWIGRQSFGRAAALADPGKMPVCIRAGALGAALPARDLWVSPGHSVLLDGVLVLARALVNGVTVTQDAASETVDYYNLDLAVHDCVIANGAFAESFADGPGLRAQFDNAGSFAALYPQARPAVALALCAPRPERGALLGAALRPVVERAWRGLQPGPVSGFIDLVTDGWTVEGWARDPTHPLLPVLLEVWAGGERLGSVLACDQRDDLEQAGLGPCGFSFAAPERPRGVALTALEVRPANGGAGLPMTTRCLGEAPHGPRLTLVQAA